MDKLIMVRNMLDGSRVEFVTLSGNPGGLFYGAPTPRPEYEERDYRVMGTILNARRAGWRLKDAVEATETIMSFSR